MDQWQESASIASPGSRVLCDPYRDLVWVGGESNVTSYFGPLLRPYSAFVVGSPVLDMQLSEKFVYTLTATRVFCHRRTGQPVSSHAAQGCFLLLCESELLIASRTRIFRYNVDTMQETGVFGIDVAENASVLFLRRCAPYVVAGLSNGTTQVIDPQTFDTLYTIRCHTGPLTDLDSRKSVIMTCGLSSRRYGIVADQIVYVWDTRVRKPLPPLNLVDGAEFVRIHPRSPTNCMVLSKSGQLHFLDAKNPGSIIIRQIAVQSRIVGMDVCASGDALAVIEENGTIHYWTRSLPLAADLTPKKLDLPTLELTSVHVGADTPLSAVGMPYYNQELLSSWPTDLVFNVGMPTSMSGSKAQKYESIQKRRSSVSAPSFISQRTQLESNEQLFEKDDSLTKGKVPRAWRKQEIVFSKYGVQDFDFKFYNRSQYSGLENERPGSNVLNGIIQLLRWNPAVHNKALEVLARHSDEPLPVLGELAVLFDMLHKANGRQCRASNFHSLLASTPEVLALGLLEPATPTQSLGPALLRHILSGLLKDSAAFEDIYGVEYNCRIYGSCGYREDSKLWEPSVDALSCDLKGIGAALSGTTENWQYCSKCDHRHSVTIFRQVTPTSPVLFINTTSAANEVATSFSFAPRIDKRSFKCVEGDDYTLQGYVCQIQYQESWHVVTIVKISGVWHMFNDFLVTPITEQEALDFGSSWKQPLMLMYVRGEQPAFDYDEWKQHLNLALLHDQRVVSGNREARQATTQLDSAQPPPRLVALDAEFVLLGQEISEIHSDGNKRLLKPQTMSLARVSVVRGTADMTPFIDDFIETREQIKNYLTLYSGIEPGDLDSETSPHALVEQKVATRRLWILLNLGTTFVGHALVNDFRTINIQVPPSQVLDTAELWYDKELGKARRMSLKFLMWAVFDDEIQTGNHDSIEDAQSALRLYFKYEELQATGEFERALEQVYEKGQRTGFRVPMTL